MADYLQDGCLCNIWVSAKTKEMNWTSFQKVHKLLQEVSNL